MYVIHVMRSKEGDPQKGTSHMPSLKVKKKSCRTPQKLDLGFRSDINFHVLLQKMGNKNGGFNNVYNAYHYGVIGRLTDNCPFFAKNSI